jgi:tetratricopeptide (TPR) repeat protein
MLLAQLDHALRQREIGNGVRLLRRSWKGFAITGHDHAQDAALALTIAQWVDVGYRDHAALETVLAHFPAAQRARMPLREYLLVRMAEAFHALLVEDADTAIDLLDFVLKAEKELASDSLTALAHFWKGRAHRKKGEYEAALAHIAEARRRAEILGALKLVAVIEIQEGWLVFQKGEPRRALQMFTHAYEQLKDTDDAISLGNIESARGRIVRRAGEYQEALEHYDRAIEFFHSRDPNHRNLARALVNSAYVKRLMAFHLRKRIDTKRSRASRPAQKRNQERGYHARYAALCSEALAQLDRAGKIYRLHHQHGGAGTVLVNAGQLHLDMGAIDSAVTEGANAYAWGAEKHDPILMARARILEAMAENARVDEQLGEDADIAVYANAAKRYAEDAIKLASQTQNQRLLAGAYIARGMTAANDFFEHWDEANLAATQASALLRSDDRDHLWEELVELKSRILRASGIDETLRSWSEGIIGDKTFQQISEEFAEIVIPKVWTREGKKVVRVAEKLSVSPKKVRRILRNVGLLQAGD